MNAFQNQKSENQFLSESPRRLILAISQLTVCCMGTLHELDLCVAQAGFSLCSLAILLINLNLFLINYEEYPYFLVMRSHDFCMFFTRQMLGISRQLCLSTASLLELEEKRKIIAFLLQEQ